MPMRRLLLLLFLLNCFAARAQDAKYLRHQIATLASPTMNGRGYVKKGLEHAEKYILRLFKEYGLRPVGKDSAYLQSYNFPVVTFPDTLALRIGKKDLAPGEEFIIDAASPSYHGSKMKGSDVDLGGIEDAKDWESQKGRLFAKPRLYRLSGLDSFFRHTGIRPHQLADALPKGAYIIPQSGKMNWDVATAQTAATIFYVEDSVLPKRIRKAAIDVHSKLETDIRSNNVMGMVRGTAQPDSFIVFTAHYDHLGRMGYDALFPGASDNASGVAMLLGLAKYYAAHPQRYSMLFIAFSGEEAGLLGSKFYTEHPGVPLAQMRFLINIDIMGDATDGVTVVNATEYPKEFSQLERLNKKGGYLPQIRSRGKAAISDHYLFSEAGVPAFFMYSNGGPGFYHDIFDRAGTLKLINIPNVAKLLQDFVSALQ